MEETGDSNTMQQSTGDEASKNPVQEKEEDPRGLQNVSNSRSYNTQN